MSSTDGQPTFAVADAEPSGHRGNLTPEERITMRKNMIKFLSKDSTVDKMRNEHLKTLLEEDDWYGRVEKGMSRVVTNCDVTKKPYIDMLKDLGYIPYKPNESSASETDTKEKAKELNKVLEELVTSPNFELKEGLKQRLFERWDILFKDKMKEAYLSSLPDQSSDN